MGRDPDVRRGIEATGTSVRLTDQRTGQSFDVAAGAVINATGVWAAEIDASLRLRPAAAPTLSSMPAPFGNPTAALTIPIPGELNRFVFAMPEQLGRVYLGLTDEAAPGPIPDVPSRRLKNHVPAGHGEHRAGDRAGNNGCHRCLRRPAGR